jgi:phosphatidylethanolamine-binding protein (PEBP) family uncharacterized protein
MAAQLKVVSSAFEQGASIPKRFTCEGEDESPPLAWSGVAAGARSLALIVDDPDAPDPAAPKMTWVHWVLYNLPPETTHLDAAHRLRRTVPADRPPSLFSQAVCAGCRAAGLEAAQQRSTAQGDAGARAGAGGADGHVSESETALKSPR